MPAPKLSAMFHGRFYRECGGCGEWLPFESFNKSANLRDGLSTYCRSCENEKGREYYQRNAEACGKKNRGNYRKKAEYRRQQNREYYQRNRDRILDRTRQYALKNKRIKSAHSALNMAVAAGKISRPLFCDDCHISCRPDAHHDDYDKPLDVAWVCRRCHNNRHAKRN